MTDFGRRCGDGDMKKADYDPVIAAIQALLNAHHARHENGGADEIDATGMTGIPVGSILGDATEGRNLQIAELVIADGTNANTLKCTLYDRWNSQNIATTDNIAKDSTTGHFTLSADGKLLTIEATGLKGNCLAAIGSLMRGWCNVHVTCYLYATSNDITIQLLDMLTGAIQDITVLVDTGSPRINIAFITDA
jgi:hypothetical protein